MHNMNVVSNRSKLLLKNMTFYCFYNQNIIDTKLY